MTLLTISARAGLTGVRVGVIYTVDLQIIRRFIIQGQREGAVNNKMISFLVFRILFILETA
jgi:hypothetical protein